MVTLVDIRARALHWPWARGGRGALDDVIRLEGGEAQKHTGLSLGGHAGAVAYQGQRAPICDHHTV